MNGEVKSYRMNEPIAWEEFNTWPKEHKITYIKLLREKFNAPDYAIAEMMGRDRWSFGDWIKSAGLNVGKNGRSRIWDKEGFLAWCAGGKDGVVNKSETPVEETTNVSDIVASTESTEYRLMNWYDFRKLPDKFRIAYIKFLREKFNVPDMEIANVMGVHSNNFGKHIRALGLGKGKAAGGHGHVWDKEGFLAWCNGIVDGEDLIAICEEADITVVEPAVSPVEPAGAEIKADDVYEIAKEEPGYKEREETPNDNNVFVEIVREVVDEYLGKKAVTDEKTPEPTPQICDNPYHRLPVIPSSGAMVFENNLGEDIADVLRSLLSGARVKLSVKWDVVNDDI